jgi:hypothetical protein
VAVRIEHIDWRTASRQAALAFSMRFQRPATWIVGQEFLHIAVAQREPRAKPDRVPDDLGREAMASVGDALHAPTLSPIALSRQPCRDKVPEPYYEFLRALRLDLRFPTPLVSSRMLLVSFPVDPPVTMSARTSPAVLASPIGISAPSSSGPSIAFRPCSWPLVPEFCLSKEPSCCPLEPCFLRVSATAARMSARITRACCEVTIVSMALNQLWVWGVALPRARDWLPRARDWAPARGFAAARTLDSACRPVFGTALKAFTGALG